MIVGGDEAPNAFIVNTVTTKKGKRKMELLRADEWHGFPSTSAILVRMAKREGALPEGHQHRGHRAAARVPLGKPKQKYISANRTGGQFTTVKTSSLLSSDSEGAVELLL